MKQIFGGKLRKNDGEAQSMRDVCATDFKKFCEYYLAESFPSPWSPFHLWLIEKIEDVVLRHSDEETRNVVAAPRGHAKSTITSFAFPIWCACYGYKKFIVIISATGPVAKQFIIDIRNELEFNDKIIRDFGRMRNDDIWNSTAVCKMQRQYGKSCNECWINFHRKYDIILLRNLERVIPKGLIEKLVGPYKWCGDNKKTYHQLFK